ncbi:MAG: hypothetical protein HXK06_08760, partial [Actinomyces graevenitzii]|nr:hypothetical protein [Actinomyces graevenitzii]
ALARIGVGRQLGQGVTFPSAAPSRRIDHFLTDALPPLGAAGQPATAVQGQPIAVAPGASAAAASGTPAAAVAGASAQGVSAAPSQGAPASGAPAGEPSAQVVDSGTFKLAISDHLVTWVDLEF